MAVGEPAVHLPGCITSPHFLVFKLLSMPGFIINKPPRRKTFQTWRQVLKTETRKVKAKNAGAVKVLKGAKLIFAGNFSNFSMTWWHNPTPPSHVRENKHQEVTESYSVYFWCPYDGMNGLMMGWMALWRDEWPCEGMNGLVKGWIAIGNLSTYLRCFNISRGSGCFAIWPIKISPQPVDGDYGWTKTTFFATISVYI